MPPHWTLSSFFSSPFFSSPFFSSPLRLPQRKRHVRVGSYVSELCHPRHCSFVSRFTANAHAFLIFNSSAFVKRVAAGHALYALSTCLSQQLPACAQTRPPFVSVPPSVETSPHPHQFVRNLYAPADAFAFACGSRSANPPPPNLRIAVTPTTSLRTLKPIFTFDLTHRLKISLVRQHAHSAIYNACDRTQTTRRTLRQYHGLCTKLVMSSNGAQTIFAICYASVPLLFI